MRVYIFCLEKVRTGGIELLHQLCHELNKQPSCEAIMFYSYSIAEKGTNPVPPDYEKYDNPYRINSVISAEDLDTAFFIVPEVGVFLFEEGYIFNKCKHKCIFWESVDNYFTANESKYHMNFVKDGTILHWAQSEYARRFLIESGVSPDMILDVGDYLNSIYLGERPEEEETGTREDVVLFNPAKGFEFTQKLIQEMPDVRFTPIKGLSFEGVVALMKKSKVYIDFGNHPGRDRIPREAAMCGLVVITGRKGSAANDVDVPIPDECKFEDTDESIYAIARRIRTCLKEYDTYRVKYDSYREIIRGEPELFSRQVRNASARMRYLSERNVSIYVTGNKDFVVPDTAEYVPLREDRDTEIKDKLYKELAALHKVWKERKGGEQKNEIIGLDRFDKFLCSPKGDALLAKGDCNFLLDECDIILPEPTKITNCTREIYINSLHSDITETVHEILLEKCPDYVGYWELCLRKKEGHFYNLFVVNSKTFYKYCEWLFDILSECEKRLGSKKAPEGIMSRIGETLLDVYVARNKLKYCEVPICNSEWG